jgi:hypothetical protein
MFFDVVTRCLRVLRICVGVLRDVTVLETSRRSREGDSAAFVDQVAPGQVCSICRATKRRGRSKVRLRIEVSGAAGLFSLVAPRYPTRLQLAATV